MEKCGFVSACAKFFGKLPGTSLKDFSEELKKLTPEDRAELAALFPSVGYEITDITTPQQIAA